MSSRAERAILQRMFLMCATNKGANGWTFLVQGSRGTCYDVHFHDVSLSCTCPDFEQRELVCKHMFFIVGRVLGDRKLMNTLGRHTSPAAAALSTAGFATRIEARLRECLSTTGDEEEEESNKYGTAGDCVVCFEQLVRASAAWACKGCGQACMHLECAICWFKRSPSCPLCRSPITSGGKEDDAMANFTAAGFTSSG